MSISQNDFNLAIQNHQKGNYKKAEDIYKKLLRQSSSNINVLYYYGLLSAQLKKYDQALNLLKRSLELNPEDAAIKDIYLVLGEIYLNLNDVNTAINYYKEVLTSDPFNLIANYNLGNIYLQLSQPTSAIEHYHKAMTNKTNEVDIYKKLIEAYSKTEDIDNIINCYQKLIELQPNNAENYFNIAIHLNKKNDIANAHNAYLNAIHLKPDMIEAHINLGNIYHRIRDFNKAKEIFLKVLELSKNYTEAYLYLSEIYVELGEAQNAIDICLKGLELFPENKHLLFYLARARLLQGDIDQGWEYFKHRREVNERTDLNTYLLDYENSLEGKKVLVYWDSGFGDSLQFVRYISLLKDIGAEVTLQIQNPLVDLIKENYPQINVLSKQEDLTKIEHDFHINLISLAYLFKGKFPFKEGYLKANPDKVRQFKEKYFNNNDFKIGISWYSHVNTYGKNIVEDLKTFYPITRMNGIKTYSLQVTEGKLSFNDIPEDIKIVNLGDTFNDFSDTAAAIENLDLIIAIDSAIVHLAAAMKKPTWTIITPIPNWRWSLYGETTPWYKSMKLFRRKDSVNMEEILERIIKELDIILNKK